MEDFERYKLSLPLVNRAHCYLASGRFTEAEKTLLEGLADRVAKFGANDEESFM